ncbi:MAG: ammonium transporter [Chitinispirillales bacterium]|jgi:Amt family ammonium transporter|nr:ammonium transporter [Chitinispirillales bacterium]
MDFGIWFLIGAALVFFMNAGFAMVESGFTRVKNSANILMKNLADFSLGTLAFILIGFSIMMSEEYVSGLIGVPNLGVFTDFENFDYANFVFNLVFCGTAATIVSGAMAERTKFSAYCIYSVVISALIYPVEAGWVWNDNGWLATMGFIDFAGSAAIHMVGGICGFVGACFLGPRIGKYSVDKATGKKVAHAIPGHSMSLGALGCFILWFGWYGFNGAAAGDVKQMGSIFMTTTLAPAAALVATMFFTWIKNGKPDVSMAINGALSGLVAITAGCASVDALGAIVIGLVAGIIVVLAIELIDFTLHVDDPVGAVAVHGVNGIWGAVAVGLFAAPVITGDGSISEDLGLFYGGGLHQLGVQTLGTAAILVWTTVVAGILFFVVKKLKGLRVEPEDEVVGLDSSEHGLITTAGDLMPMTSADLQMIGATKAASASAAAASVASSVSVSTTDSSSGKKLTKVTIITRRSMFDALKNAFDQIGITGVTVTNVLGYGLQRGVQKYRGVVLESQLLPKIQVDIVVSKVPVELVVETAKKVLHTGNIGDGKIFVYDVENVIKVRTGETGYDALQDSAAAK